MIGQTLSHYQVLEELGSGGMGVVYRARDTKLHRDVAIKILPRAASSPERHMRFEREAKAVAALDHPNIVTIYSVEEADGVPFYTMQLVEGRTLTELIPKNGLALNRFFEIAIPLADAVSAAHEQGIIHRDLKPDNLMIGDDGRLRILDFGLAKLRQEWTEPGMSELPTQSATGEGRILGTVAYMSPEQAEGKAIDHRSDIFSLGIILYEMATGERPFKGDTTASMLSSILRDTPTSVIELNPEIPRDLAKLIRRCLAKNTDDRLQAAKDLRNELRELKQELESGELLPESTPRKTAAARRWLVPVVLVLAAASIVILLMRRPPPSSSLRTTLTQLTSRAGIESFPNLGPDGNNLIYVSGASGNDDIYLQRVGGQRAINLTADSIADDSQPAFSPDGSRIVFRSERDGGGLFVMGATGESVKRMTDDGFNPSWSPDGEFIVFSTVRVTSPDRYIGTGELRAVRVDTGEVRTINVNGDAVQPSWSPHGSRIAFWSYSLSERNYRDIWTVSAEGGDVVAVTQDKHIDWNPVWSPDGNYIYFSSNRGGTRSLWRVRIEEETGITTAKPVLVTTSQAARIGQIAIAGDGRHIAYQADLSVDNLHKIAFDTESEAVVGDSVAITSGSRDIREPDESPNGRWVAFSFYPGGGQADLAIIGTDGTGLRQLTDEPHLFNYMPRWSPDGDELVFYSARSESFELWSIRTDGSDLRQLTKTPYRIQHFAWSPDGGRIVYYSTDGDSYIFKPRIPWENQSPEKLPPPPEGRYFYANSWSPDGDRLAGLISYGPGRRRIAVFSLASREYEVLPSGINPIWLSDGRRMLYWNREKLFLLDTKTGHFKELLDGVGNNNHALSRDERTIYFGLRRREADIWMVSLDEEPH